MTKTPKAKGPSKKEMFDFESERLLGAYATAYEVSRTSAHKVQELRDMLIARMAYIEDKRND